jgi:hypothetical protein
MTYSEYKIENPLNKIYLMGFLVLLLFIVPTGLLGQKSAQLIQSSKTDSAKHSSNASAMWPVIGSIDEYIESHNEPPYEKIFLHSDRHTYLQSDTIWFKAYLWYGYEQQPDTTSGILYVDLIDTQGHIILKRKLLIQNGTSHGDFCLDTTIIPGSYLLRAYTHLMQILDAGEPFYQPITINSYNQNFQFECNPVILKQIINDSLKIGFKFFEIDPTGNLNKSYYHKINYSLKIGKISFNKDSILLENTKEYFIKYSLADFRQQDSIAEFAISIRDKGLTFEKKFQIPLQDNIDLQFFPEGGTLVNGLKSKVAFRAIGQDGLGREIAGEIRTDDDNIVSDFKSTNKGMGMFTLQPLVKKEYFAHFWYNNQKYIVPLPHISPEGSTISVSFPETGNDRSITIKQAPSGVTTSKYVIGSSYGKIWFSALIKTLMDSCKLQVPLEMIPEGVCRLTVLNAGFEPECERLIYVDKNQHFKIEVIPDSSSYVTRSKVTLLIRATDPKGIPVHTDLSLAVVDKEQSPKDAEVSGIKAYKLLKSELQGFIEDPDSYFKNDSCTNKVALDLLLLTQGYRKFLPNSTKSSEHILSPEKNLYVSGKIKFNGSKSQERKLNYPNIGLNLISVSEKPYVGLTHPDSIGLFSFQLPLMPGRQRLMLQAKTPKNKPFNGDIFIDSPVAPPLFTTLPTLNNTLSFPTVEYINRIQAVKKTDISRITLPGSMSVTLGEVVVTAKANPKNWWRNYDKDATKIADLDFLDPEGDKYRDLNDLLVEEFGARRYSTASGGLNTVLLPCVKTISMGWNASYWFPIYLLDGKLYWNGEGFDFSKLETLSAYPVNEIKRILVIPPGKSIAMNYAYPPIIGFPQFILQSMVIIETYSKNTYRGDIQGVKKFILDGLDVPRVFYSPRYEGTMKKNPEYDGRATILWEPSILTDVNGQAKVDFFSSDRQTNFEVIVNGIQIESGSPGEGRAQINTNFKRSEKQINNDNADLKIN